MQELEPHNIQFKSSSKSLSEIDNNSYTIVVLGPTGCGKSTIINHLFNKTVCITGAAARSVTQELKFLKGDLIKSDISFDKVTIIDTIGNHQQ